MGDSQQQQDNKNNSPPAATTAIRITNNTTTAATPAATNGGPGEQTSASFQGIRINPRYFTTIPGILKVVEWVFAIICIACAAPAIFPGVHWFLLVVVLCFLITFLWMCVHFFSITNLVSTVPWLIIEIGYTAGASVLYFIAMLVMLIETTSTVNESRLRYFHGVSRYDAYITAGVFGLFNCIVYAVEAALHFLAWRSAPETKS